MSGIIQEIQALSGDIVDLLNIRATESRKLLDNITKYNLEFEDIKLRLVHLGQAERGFSGAHGPMRDALQHLLKITHDLEIVVKMDKILKRAGLDLSALVPTLESNETGFRFDLSQDGTAQIHYSHTAPCLVVDQGQLAIEIPIKIKDGEEEYHSRLNLVIGLTRAFGSAYSGVFQRILTRSPHFCPPIHLGPVVEREILNEIEPVLREKIRGLTRLPRLPQFGAGPMILYGAMFGPLFRVHGEFTRRRRRIIAPLPSLPDWADSAFKLDTDILLNKVLSVISRSPASLRGGPHLRNSNVLDFDVGIHRAYGTKLGCVEYSISIDISGTVRTHFRIIGSNTLRVDVSLIGPTTDIRIRPKVLAELLKPAERWAEAKIGAAIPALSESWNYEIPSARQATVQADLSTITVFMQTRNSYWE